MSAIKTQTELKKDILELMVFMLTDPKTDKLPEGYEEVFKEFETDAEGAPYLQTLAGMVSMTKDANVLNYSPNFGYHAEQVAFETSNLCKLAVKSGWDFVINAAHYVLPDGQMLMGDMGYNAWRQQEMNTIINILKQRQQQKNEESDTPKLILPDTNIIKPH